MIINYETTRSFRGIHSVYHIPGKQVFEEDLDTTDPGADRLTWNVEKNQSSGIYFIEISNRNGQILDSAKIVFMQ